LALANPLHLRDLIEKYPQAPIVLLHASYPYCRESSYLISVYCNVFADYSLIQLVASKSGMRESLKMLLELAPTTKILYASDAHSIPELYYCGAKNAKCILKEVLENAILEGDINNEEALEIANQILHKNATKLYKL